MMQLHRLGDWYSHQFKSMARMATVRLAEIFTTIMTCCSPADVKAGRQESRRRQEPSHRGTYIANVAQHVQRSKSIWQQAGSCGRIRVAGLQHLHPPLLLLHLSPPHRLLLPLPDHQGWMAIFCQNGDNTNSFPSTPSTCRTGEGSITLEKTSRSCWLGRSSSSCWPPSGRRLT